MSGLGIAADCSANDAAPALAMASQMPLDYCDGVIDGTCNGVPVVAIQRRRHTRSRNCGRTSRAASTPSRRSICLCRTFDYGAPTDVDTTAGKQLPSA